MVPRKVTTLHSLSVGKPFAYPGPTFVSQGLEAPYVTQNTHVCPVRIRVTYELSYSLSNCGVVLFHHLKT